MFHCIEFCRRSVGTAYFFPDEKLPSYQSALNISDSKHWSEKFFNYETDPPPSYQEATVVSAGRHFSRRQQRLYHYLDVMSSSQAPTSSLYSGRRPPPFARSLSLDEVGSMCSTGTQHGSRSSSPHQNNEPSEPSGGGTSTIVQIEPVPHDSHAAVCGLNETDSTSSIGESSKNIVDEWVWCMYVFIVFVQWRWLLNAQVETWGIVLWVPFCEAFILYRLYYLILKMKFRSNKERYGFVTGIPILIHVQNFVALFWNPLFLVALFTLKD